MSRAFFYAGARALLVSHWAVDSDATVKLITKTLSIMATDKTIGRSEALRRSMVALIEQGALNEAHPAYWAHFVVVGEGSAGVLAPPPIAPRPSSPSHKHPQSGRPLLPERDLSGRRARIGATMSGGSSCTQV
jgi:CHAT domain